MKYLGLCVLLLLISCKCRTKAEVLQERQDTLQHIKQKHGEVAPPTINEVPDISECKKS